MRIGFRLSQYDYFEPDFDTIITNLTLIKEDNRLSEQTFGVIVIFHDPGAGVRPATLQESFTQETPFDYLIDTPGNDDIVLVFQPFQSEITANFILLSDELPEGTEAFRASVESEGGFFPHFQVPGVISVNIPAYSSTLVRILDDERKLYTRTKKLLYVTQNGIATHFQRNFFGSICIVI